MLDFMHLITSGFQPQCVNLTLYLSVHNVGSLTKITDAGSHAICRRINPPLQARTGEFHSPPPIANGHLR